MPISAVTSDYSGRTKDISIAYKVNPTFVGAQNTDLKFGPVSAYCSGVQKLVQRYMIALLTQIGSQPGYPNFGTGLLAKLHNSGGLTKTAVGHIFNFANANVVAAFREYQTANPSNFKDEQLNTATLNNVSVGQGNISLNINILTVSGTNVVFVVPIPIQ